MGRVITEIYIHHSASRKKKTDLDLIDRWHKERGWKGVGYHWVIEAEGVLKRGRHIDVVGAHVKGKNKHSVGICVCGNFEEEEPDAKQLETLWVVVNGLQKLYGIPKEKVFAHREAGSTLCCGKNLYEELLKWRGDKPVPKASAKKKTPAKKTPAKKKTATKKEK